MSHSLTLAQVRAWVEQQPTGSIVGHSVEPDQCPIARAAAAILAHGVHVTVIVDQARIALFRGRSQLPHAVAVDFDLYDLVSSIDRLPGHLYGPITREQILTVLDQIEVYP